MLPERPIRDVSWRGQVESRVNDLRADLACARAGSCSNAAQEAFVEGTIELAHEIAADAPTTMSPTWIQRWYSGADIEAAWSAIHRAEAFLIMILPRETVHARLSDLRAALTTTLKGDGRVEGYEIDLKTIEVKGVAGIGLPERERIRVIKSAIDSASDAAHLNIRNYRNWLLIVSTVVTVSLVIAAVVHSRNSEFLYIIESGSQAHRSADVAQLEVAGAVGGLLMALFALIRLQVYSGPVALPLWQALVRVPAGAAAGLVGAALIQGGTVSAIARQSRSGLIGYAVLFGAAPELVLRFLDKRVNNATSAARPSSDPLKSVPIQSSPSAEGLGLPVRGAKPDTSPDTAPK